MTTALPQYSHVDVMARLLALGPLTHHEAVEITGWKSTTVSRTLQHLRSKGEARPMSVGRRNVWLLTSLARFAPISDFPVVYH